MTDTEYFCPNCKKFVKEIRSEFGSKVMPGFNFPGGELPAFVCDKCDAPVMEFTKSDGKSETKVL